MLNCVTRVLAASVVVLGAGTTGALADSCSGHNHNTGTVLGAVGGGAIGAAATHGSLGGVLGGAVLGGLAGNAVSRDMDCRHGYRHARYNHGRYYYRHGHRYARW